MAQDHDNFTISRIRKGEDEAMPRGGVLIIYRDGVSFARYGKGLDLERPEGSIVEEETAALEMIYSNTRGLGRKLLARTVEHATESGFHYLRSTTIVTPRAIRMTEHALQRGDITERAYHVFGIGEMFDLASVDILERSAMVTPDMAMEAVGKVPRVESVIRLAAGPGGG